MWERVNHGLRALGWRLHGFALGMTLALAAPLLAQGCVAGGQ